ncbi:MAG: CcmD family protein [Firmicutes bacterium]|nr:CcmD family protein [Bacillota bacterium]
MNHLFLVFTVTAVGWIGLFFYLLRLDLRIKRLEKKK